MNYKRYEIGPIKDIKRVLIKDQIELTGCEVSINRLPKGLGSPFIHSHKENEEVYIFTEGSGIAYLDEEEVEIIEGTTLNIAPEVRRGFKANDHCDLSFICIQAKMYSLKQATRKDGIIHKDRPSWFK